MRALLIALLVGFSSTAALSTSVPLTEKEIVERSEIVGRVTVLSAQSRWLGRRIVTVYELRLEETWKGEALAQRTATLAVPGGVVDGIGQKVAGAPELVVGQRYVLCLSAPSLEVGAVKARGLVGLYKGAWAELDDGSLRSFVHGGTPEVLVPQTLRSRIEAAR